MRKKLLACTVLFAMLLSLAACGSISSTTQTTAAADSSEATETAAAAETTESAAPTASEEANTFADGAGVWPVSDTLQTITVWDGWFPFFSAFFADYNDTQFFQEMEKRTNVHCEFTLVNAEIAAEQFNLMIASGEYCDLIHDVDTNYVGGVDKAYEEGVIMDITDLINTWMPNYKAVLDSNETFKTDCVSDLGNIYQFHNLKVDRGYPDYGLIIRQDWLDQLGMDRPQTYEEYYDVLTAFKTVMGASAPMMLSNTGDYQGNFFASGFGVNGTLVNNAKPFYQVDGTVKYGPMEDGYRDYLETMAKWYSEGLIYKDFYTYQESNTMPPDELVTGDQMGLFGANITDISERYNSVMGDNSTLHLTGAYDPVQNDGDINHFGSEKGASVAGGYCVSTNCKDPEVVARWADYIYTDEGQLLSNYGVEGVSFDNQADGTPKLSALVLHNDTMPTMLALTKYTTFSLVGVEDPYRMYAEFTDDQTEAGEIWSEPDAAYTIPSGVNMTTEESETFNAAYSDIASFVQEHTLQVILGQEDLSDWDTYVQHIKDMGIAACLEQQQAALDRYNT